jgi:hypothetical protein
MRPPGSSEIIGLAVVVLAVVLVLKLARVAIRLMLFLVGLLLIIGFFYFVMVR